MEDTPLIVRQSLNNEKCASCGHFLEKNFNPHNRSNSVSQQTQTNNQENIKYNLKHLHDQCVKYGTGSYSRILSNYNAETLKDEFQQLNCKTEGRDKEIKKIPTDSSNFKTIPTDLRNFKTINTNISYNFNNSKIFNKEPAKKKFDVASRNGFVDEDSRLNTMIDSELQNLSLRGENLVKLTNRYYKDNKEKKK